MKIQLPSKRSCHQLVFVLFNYFGFFSKEKLNKILSPQNTTSKPPPSHPHQCLRPWQAKHPASKTPPKPPIFHPRLNLCSGLGGVRTTGVRTHIKSSIACTCCLTSRLAAAFAVPSSESRLDFFPIPKIRNLTPPVYGSVNAEQVTPGSPFRRT